MEKKKDHLFKNKKSMDRFVKLIKATPVVPLFGDVSTTLESILKRAKHMEPGKFSYDANDEALKKSYSILSSIPEIREQYKTYVADFGVVMNEVCVYFILFFFFFSVSNEHLPNIEFSSTELIPQTDKQGTFS